MKTNHGLLWSEEHADKTITLGFTKTAIDNQLQECFHVFQADTKEVREKGPLLVLETNDGLQSIKAPFAGRVSYFNPKARNFPDRIKETDTILTLVPKGVVLKKTAPPEKTVSEEFVTVNMNWPAPQTRTAAEVFAQHLREQEREQERHQAAIEHARMRRAQAERDQAERDRQVAREARRQVAAAARRTTGGN